MRSGTKNAQEIATRVKTSPIFYLKYIFFVFAHLKKIRSHYFYIQICNLTEIFPEITPQIVRGCYWGILIIAILRSFTQLPKPGLRTSLTIILFTCVAILAQDIGLHGITQAQNWLTHRIQPGTSTFWWLVACYALILAIPFMPGIELGLLLMLMFGEPGILAAYGATVLGLFVPYLLGRVLPKQILNKLFKNKVLSLGTLNNRRNATAYLNKIVNSRLVQKALRYRSVTLAVAFNLPCNSLIGGGGSIAIFTGAQRFVSLRTYILIITLATLPVPLMAYAGVLQIESFLAGQELTQVTAFCPKY